MPQPHNRETLSTLPSKSTADIPAGAVDEVVREAAREFAGFR